MRLACRIKGKRGQLPVANPDDDGALYLKRNWKLLIFLILCNGIL
jgi:hypothetical protein